MNDLEKAARQALEALEQHLTHHEHGCVYLDPAVTALRQALEQKQEPVAWMVDGSLYASKEVAQKMGGNAYTLQALYTEPPKKEWIGLTDEHINDAVRNLPIPSTYLWIARAIEAKIKELNT